MVKFWSDLVPKLVPVFVCRWFILVAKIVLVWVVVAFRLGGKGMQSPREIDGSTKQTHRNFSG